MNAVRLAEGIVLLDLIRTIANKSYQIELGEIQVVIDNRKVWQMTQEDMKAENHSNQNSAAETMAIKRLIEEYSANIELVRIIAYKEIQGNFREHSLPHIIQMYYIKVN